jgi:hypothetical protein
VDIMPRQLPKVFVNKIDKQIKNNNDIFYSKDTVKKNVIKEEKEYTPLEIREKVMNIFNSPNFVYKMDVQIIKKNNEVLNKRIIAMVNDVLLTLDEDKIALSDIKDIKEKTT